MRQPGNEVKHDKPKKPRLYFQIEKSNKKEAEKKNSTVQTIYRLPKNVYLGIGFDEKSTICRERHSLIFSGISGISETYKKSVKLVLNIN